MYNSRGDEAGNCQLSWISFPRRIFVSSHNCLKLQCRVCGKEWLWPLVQVTLVRPFSLKGLQGDAQLKTWVPLVCIQSSLSLIFLCPFQEHRSMKQIATCSAGVWCWASQRLWGHFVAWGWWLKCPETLKQPARAHYPAPTQISRQPRGQDTGLLLLITCTL